MTVGSCNERGLGGGREGIKMPRPKTANATLGRGHIPYSTGVRGVRAGFAALAYRIRHKIAHPGKTCWNSK
ncbi:unnamed protein product [Ectocarpus sp. 4 AP-2014]